MVKWTRSYGEEMLGAPQNLQPYTRWSAIPCFIYSLENKEKLKKHLFFKVYNSPNKSGKNVKMLKIFT